MSRTSETLVALARLGVIKIPAADWDALIPKATIASLAQRGIIIQGGHVTYDAESAALNPQPIPPLELQVGVTVFTEVLRASIAGAGMNGADGVAKLLHHHIVGWCGNEPRVFPPLPLPWPKIDPRSPDLQTVFLGAALAAAQVRTGYDGVIGEALDDAVEQLLEAGLR